MQPSTHEDHKTEFKKSLDEDAIAKTMTAFANGHGGRVYVGISDDGNVVGARIGKQKLEQFTRRIHDDTTPPIAFETRFEKSGSEEVLVIEVHPAKRKPVFYLGLAYKRVNKTTLKITDPEELRSLFVNKTVFFDDTPCPSAGIKDLDEETIRQFTSMAVASGRLAHPATKEDEFLVKLGLMEGQELKNGAVMLFGRDPSAFFPVWGIRCAVVSSGMDFQDMQDFNGNLILSIDQALLYIRSKVPKEMKVEGLRRVETPRIPERAIREALVNAVAHRDYFFPSFVYVTIGPDYVEIKNPGRLEGLTPDDLSKVHSSVIKNPNIARAFFLCKYIETWGSGTVKIYQAMRQNGLKDPQFGFDPMFSVRLSMQPQKLNERQKYILAAIQAGKSLKPTEVANKYDISVSATVGDFAHLVELGLIQKSGKGRSSVFALTKVY
ncbi:MAG: RNA-binding domain-containing protein [Candidatus Micrarchaeota archaeon]